MENKTKTLAEVLDLIKEKRYQLDFKIDVPDEFKGNIEVIRCILENGNLDFEKLPDIIKNDKEILMFIAKKDSSEFRNFPDWAKDDKDIVKSLSGWGVFENISERLRADREIVMLGLSGDSSNNLEHVTSEELKNDKEILKIAVSGHSQALHWVPEKWRHDKELLDIILSKEVTATYSFEHFPLEYRDNEEIARKVVNDDYGRCYQYLSERLKNNKEITLIATSKSGDVLSEMPKSMLDDKDVVLNALAHDGWRYVDKISERLKNDIDIVTAAVLSDNRSLEDFPDNFKDNEKVIEACLKGNGSAYKYFSERFKNDRKIALEMSAKWDFDLGSAPEIFKNDREIVKNAIKEDANNFKYIGSELLKDFAFLKEIYMLNDGILYHMDENLKAQLFTTQVQSAEYRGKKIIYEMVIDDGYVQNKERPVKSSSVRQGVSELVRCDNFPVLTYEDDGPVGSYLSVRYLNNILLIGDFTFFIKENTGKETYTNFLGQRNVWGTVVESDNNNDDFLKHEVYLIPESTTEFSYDNLNVLPRLYFGKTDNLPNGIKLFPDHNSYSEALTILKQKEVYGKAKFKKINTNTLEAISDKIDEISGAARVFVDGYGWRFLIPHKEGALKALEVLKSTTINDDIIWIKNQDSQSAILRASENGYLEIVQSLLKDKNENFIPTINNALVKASANNFAEIVKELIIAGADVNFSNSNGDTALIWACCNGNSEIVELLLEAKVNVNYKNKDKSAIDYCANGNLKILKLLIHAGSDIKSLSVESFENLAISYKESGEYLKSIDYFKKVFEINNTGYPFFEIGVCYEFLNDKENALKSFIKSAEIRLERVGKGDNRTIESVNKSLSLAKELNAIDTLPEWFKTV